MKDHRLEEYLSGKEFDYVTPFYWQHGAEKRQIDIPTRVRQLYEDGNRSLCVESRPHPNFCKDEWWSDMKLLCATAKELGMKVWIMDTKHYPTGYISGFADNWPHLRLWNISEIHMDLIGPVEEGMVLTQLLTPTDEIIGVYAYRRTETSEKKLTTDFVDLTDKVSDGVIWVDLPDGVWRIMTVFKTHKGVSESFVSTIDPESVQVLIDEVYEKHYEILNEYVGNTFVGFFSDEPRFRNQQVRGRFEYGYYDKTVGLPFLGLPWSKEVAPMMKEELGADPYPLLAALWYDTDGFTDKVRLAYMNAISSLYGKHFSGKIGKWCEEHGMLYIGHVIEDMGCHARLGNGNAHFYRAQLGQDMSGIDVVLFQVVPGFAHFDHKSEDAYLFNDSAFYHYVLCQMGASSAHINKKMNGRAMGEIFAAYGWVEDVPMMKWQADYMLVRGINYFIPNGYDDLFPDPDCPPQLGVRIDPQLEAYQHLTPYMNRMAHLLSGGTHIANAAILYHAEAEWMNGKDNYVDMSVPARALYDSHVCYDILPVDAICEECRVEGEKLKIADESFDALFLPYAPRLPERMISVLKDFDRAGLPIFFVGGIPEGFEGIGKCVNADEIPAIMQNSGFYDIQVDGEYPLLRHYHIRRGESDVYFFFNESVTEAVDTTVTFKQNGICTVIDDAGGHVHREMSDGRVRISLVPYESVVLIFNGEENCEISEAKRDVSAKELNLTYEISVASREAMSDFKPLTVTDKLFNITGRSNDPHFSGKIRYKATLCIDEIKDYVLDLGKVGQVASVRLNGEDIGLRMCAPFRFDISKALIKGENKLEITVSNTLVYSERDPLSPSGVIPPSGLLGPIKLIEAL